MHISVLALPWITKESLYLCRQPSLSRPIWHNEWLDGVSGNHVLLISTGLQWMSEWAYSWALCNWNTCIIYGPHISNIMLVSFMMHIFGTAPAQGANSIATRFSMPTVAKQSERSNKFASFGEYWKLNSFVWCLSIISRLRPFHKINKLSAYRKLLKFSLPIRRMCVAVGFTKTFPISFILVEPWLRIHMHAQFY